MKENSNDWIPFHQIDWTDKDIQSMSIDTRDFHTIVNYTPVKEGYKQAKIHPFRDILVLTSKSNKNKFMYDSLEEIHKIILNLYETSGGEGKWRMLITTDITSDWRLKYLRIYNYEGKYFITDAYNHALNKDTLTHSVNKEHLNHH